MQQAAAEERADTQVRGALEAQLEQLRSAHATQLSALRDELAALQRQHQELKEYVLSTSIPSILPWLRTRTNCLKLCLYNAESSQLCKNVAGNSSHATLLRIILLRWKCAML